MGVQVGEYAGGQGSSSVGHIPAATSVNTSRLNMEMALMASSPSKAPGSMVVSTLEVM